jgi:hypothetical protein
MAVNYSSQTLDLTYVDMWEKATQTPNGLTIPVGSRSDFQRLRFKLYHTRKVMEAQHHPLASLVMKYSVTSEKKGEQFILTIGPTDAKLKNYLETLGFGLGRKNNDDDDIPPELDPTK